MKLKKLTLKDFRCYGQLDLELHPSITVLCANNGQGKTAILDAIRIGLWPFVSQFDLAKTAYADPANTIRIDDVLVSKTPSGMLRKLPSEINLEGNYGQGIQQWKRFRDSEAARSQIKDNPGSKALKLYADTLQQEIRNPLIDPISLPVFGYYGTGRLWKEKKLVEKKRNHKSIDENIRTFAYRNALDPASSYKQFEEWFTSAYKKIREEQIKQLEAGKSSIKADPTLENPVTVVQEAVNKLLSDTGWQNIAYSETADKSLVLEHPEKGILKADQLSDGIKNMLAMVADIAYRCSLLNAHLGAEAAIKSEGVVMIDEVDMHLHPQWQQTIIQGLTDAFPAIQFIVTTHSSQVLSTVNSESIRMIHHYQDPENGQWLSEAKQPENQSRGVASTQLLAEIQDVDPVPNVMESRWLSEYKSLIVQNESTSPQAKQLEAHLIEHFGENHPEIRECKRIIRLQEMKNKHSKRT